ncbi:hypothetical protein ES159_00825 [Klebsiella aerogenes]|nr:hypothetical protein ES159_00825 [Klebsiella aerogenes]
MISVQATLFCRVALRLPGLRSVRPAFNLFTMLAETAAVGGLKIAETLPAVLVARLSAAQAGKITSLARQIIVAAPAII